MTTGNFAHDKSAENLFTDSFKLTDRLLIPPLERKPNADLHITNVFYQPTKNSSFESQDKEAMQTIRHEIYGLSSYKPKQHTSPRLRADQLR